MAGDDQNLQQTVTDEEAAQVVARQGARDRDVTAWRASLLSLVILLSRVWLVVISPFQFGFFNKSLPFIVFVVVNAIISLIFLVDYYGIIKINCKEKKYSKGFLPWIRSRFDLYVLLELASLVPWDLIYRASSYRMSLFMLWIRLIYLIRVWQSIVRQDRSLKSIIGRRICKILQLALLDLYWSHVAACILYYTASSSTHKESSWMGSIVMGSTDYSNFEHLPVWTRYITSVYFATATITIIGYGDIHPTSVAEIIVVKCILVLNLLVIIFNGLITSSLVKALGRASDLKEGLGTAVSQQDARLRKEFVESGLPIPQDKFEEMKKKFLTHLILGKRLDNNSASFQAFLIQKLLEEGDEAVAEEMKELYPDLDLEVGQYRKERENYLDNPHAVKYITLGEFLNIKKSNVATVE